MAILKVAQLGHPILRIVAPPLDPERIHAPEIRQLITDMLETMAEYEGAGLAAPQVHVSTRLVVLTLDADEPPEIWINPELTPLTDQTEAVYEGCLSIAGLRGRVARPAAVHARYLDAEGTPRAFFLQGFPAIVAQHECDHLDGVLYIDKADPRTLAFLPEFQRFGPLHQQLELPPQQEGDDEPLDDFAIELDPTLEPHDALAAAMRHHNLED
ncbi:MAG: peptide deformylase [Deltaproteobacteria bacterium]|nr:MAG: peptide deformylase [Deltaproteobacteria bacterium]